VISPKVSRALGNLITAAKDPRWRDRPEFDGLRAFVLGVSLVEPSLDDDDHLVIAAFTDNPDRVAQIRKLAPYLDEAGWHGDIAGAARTLGFDFP